MIVSTLSEHQVTGYCSIETPVTALSNWLRSKEQDGVWQRSNAKKRRAEQGTALVMIVDDEPVVAITLAEILMRRGMNVVWFTQPLAAVEYARDGVIDLLLSDFTMPLMDGVLLATEVAKFNRECAVFLLSAVCDQPEVAAKILTLGPGAHVEAKPVHIPVLVATVEALLSGR